MSSVRLKLPATSANLGPGFDTLAIALALYLEVEAEVAPTWSIEATGRSPEVCGAVDRNLLLYTFREVWKSCGEGEAPALKLRVRNGIPLGMGCGSSAASRIAGIALASHFSGADWTRARMLDEAARLEHHPDNAAGCILGGFVASGYAAGQAAGNGAGSAADRFAHVEACSIPPPASWRAMLALPEVPLATTISRGVVPDRFERPTVVRNLQNVALLVAAFASGDGQLLRSATVDGMHQPFRGDACPLLPCLLPLAGREGILSVTLSGAGSGVLLILEDAATEPGAETLVRDFASKQGIGIAEVLTCSFAAEGAELGCK